MTKSLGGKVDKAMNRVLARRPRGCRLPPEVQKQVDDANLTALAGPRRRLPGLDDLAAHRIRKRMQRQAAAASKPPGEEPK